MKVMNEPQTQNVDIDVDDKDQSVSHFSRLRPNLDLRPLIRRMYPIFPIPTFAVEPDSARTFTIPLSRFLAETTPDASAFATPIQFLSRMFYGKSVSFKFNLEFRYNIASIGVDLADNSNTFDIAVYYIPPNFTFNLPQAVVTGAPVNLNLSEVSTLPRYDPGFPSQLNPVLFQNNKLVYEFTTPDLSYYKFMGSPSKFESFSSPVPSTGTLSTNDFGSLYVRAINYGLSTSKAVTLRVTVGLTDESRFGMHSLAPPYSIDKSISPYLLDSGATPAPKGALGVYKGGFIPVV